MKRAARRPGQVGQPAGPVGLADAIARYLDACAARQLSRATRAGYAVVLRGWASWLAGRAVLRVDQLTAQDLAAWAEEAGRDWQPSTRKSAYTAVRTFLTWCRKDADLLTDNLARVLKTPHQRAKLQRMITTEEAGRLLGACAAVAKKGITAEEANMACKRNAALICLLFDTVLRASDICQIRVEDLNLDQCALGVCGGRAAISEETARRLRAWLKVRRAQVGVDTVFVGVGGATPGEPLTRQGLLCILQDLAARAGVAGVTVAAFGRAGPHTGNELRAAVPVLYLTRRWQDPLLAELYRAARRAEKAPIHDRTTFGPDDYDEGY